MESDNSIKFDQFSEIIIVSNRGPVTFSKNVEGEVTFKRGSGGLVTALTGLAHHTKLTWVACAMSEEDAEWKQGEICSENDDCNLSVYFINPAPEAYEGYYNQISNPLLWFLQHSMWDVPRSPVIDHQTWIAWDTGYQVVNRQFAREISELVKKMDKPVLIMLQDYHLYLTARYLKKFLRGQDVTISLFVHIPLTNCCRAPARSDNIKTPSFWFTIGPSFATKFIPSAIELTNNTSYIFIAATARG